MYLRRPAGPLTAEFEGGNLRYIRLDGAEMLRAVSFIVRDRNWGTYNPRISNLKIAEEDDGFRVSYDAVARDDLVEAPVVGRHVRHIKTTPCSRHGAK